MAGDLSAVGKPEWIAQFLLRAEASAMATAEKLGELDYVGALLRSHRAAGTLFHLLLKPEIAAYINQEAVEGWERRVPLASYLGHGNDEQPIAEHPCAILKTPHPYFVRVLQNMKIGSQGKDSSRCNPLAIDHPFYAEHGARISAALGLLCEHCPDFYDLATTYLRRLVLVDEAASFRGATSYHARGLSYFRPRDRWDAYVWAEELVHEGTHNQVHTLLTFDHLVTGENRLKADIPGPLRADLRHHFGNFQSLHVISRLVRLNETLAAAGHQPERLRLRNAELGEKSRLPFRRLRDDAELTAIGRAIYEAETRPVLEALCESGISSSRTAAPDIRGEAESLPSG